MEIKTCEQFVVTRLMELENTVESQKEIILDQANIIKHLEEKIAFVRDLIVVNKAHDYTPENPRMFIDMHTAWNTYNPERFNEIRRVLDLPLPEDGEEEEE